MPAASQQRRGEEKRPHQQRSTALRAGADGSLFYASGALPWLAPSTEEGGVSRRRLPLEWRWMILASLGVHAVLVTAVFLLPAGGAVLDPYQQAMRVNLILAPEAARPAEHAGTSGSQPASAKPAVAPAPDPTPLPAEPESAHQLAEPVVIQPPVPEPAREAPTTAKAAPEPTPPPPVTQAQSGDSDVIPAEWSRAVGSSATSAAAIFQARFRESPAPPSYPVESVARNEEGTVWVDLYLSEQGKVLELRIVRSSGFPRLDRAAAAAVHRWRFQPSRRLGFPVASWVRVPVHFQLH